MVNMIHNQCAAEKLHCHPLVFLVKAEPRSLATPSTPVSRSTPSGTDACFLCMLVSGEKCRAAKSSFFQILDQPLFAVVSLSVTIFWILPPRAVSMAVSYFFSA